MGNKLKPEKIRHSDGRKFFTEFLQLAGKNDSYVSGMKKIYAELLKKEETGELSLNLSSAGLGDGVVGLMIDALLNTKVCISQVSLKNNGLTKQSCAKIAKYIEEMACLKVLDLSDNSIGAGGLRALAEPLRTDESLLELHINNIGAGIDGASVISDILETNKVLQGLELANNGFEQRSMGFFAEALRNNHTLKILKLDGNDLKESRELEFVNYIVTRNHKIDTLVDNMIQNSIQRTFKARQRNFNKSIKGQQMLIGRRKQMKEIKGTKLMDIFEQAQERAKKSNVNETREIGGRFKIGMAEMMGKRSSQDDVSVFKLNWLDDLGTKSLWTYYKNFIPYAEINAAIELSEDEEDEQEIQREAYITSNKGTVRIQIPEGRTEFFALFDGHGGREAAEHAAEMLDVLIRRNISENDMKLEEAISQSFFELHNDMKSWCLYSGTTALVTIIIDEICYIANLGDSRAVLSRDGKAFRLSRDQKPDDEKEKARIRQAGGEVIDGRIDGILAVARALGDGQLGDKIYPKPKLVSFRISSRDEFIIMACDGVWDVIKDEEAVKIVGNEIDPMRAAKKLRDEAFNQGSQDNISVIVISLR